MLKKKNSLFRFNFCLKIHKGLGEYRKNSRLKNTKIACDVIRLSAEVSVVSVEVHVRSVEVHVLSVDVDVFGLKSPG